MLRSLYSGISGMTVNQSKLDVIGNNIANVGTTSYKFARVRFQDMMSQTSAAAMSPSSSQGGTNPRQIGLGVQLSGIDTIMSTGMMQPTNRPLDAAIDGEGYFVVAKGPETFNANGITVDANHNTTVKNGSELMYSRDGAFALDSEGNLLTSDGYRVLGYSVTGVTTAKPAVPGVYTITPQTDNIDITPPGGTLTTFTYSDTSADDGTSDFKTAKGLAALINADTNLNTTYNATVSGSNVILTQLAGQEGPAVPTLSTTPTPPASPATMTTTTTGSVAVASTPTLSSIDTNGNIVFADAKNTITADTSSLKTLRIPDVVKNGSVDDKVLSFSIEKDGQIKAVLASGNVAAIGQIAMAAFKNPGGLEKLGKNLYSVSSNSGTPTLRSGAFDPTNAAAKAADNSGAFGDMMGNTLEMSNVDLAEQFTEMIVASRAFQANGKTITTGDEILQDIINLIR